MSTMMIERAHSPAETDLMATAKRVLPAGTFGNTALDIVIERGERGRVWDVSGNEYVDYLLGSGPMLIGHCHPKVKAAVEAQLAKGTTFFVNNPEGIRLAKRIVGAMACAEQVRFVSSGTEADLYAMRVARAHTRREKILKFEGGYHGMSDYGLMSLAPKRLANFPRAVPDSAGIPRSVQDEMIVAPFNDLAAVASLVAQHGKEIAAIIVEPMQRLIPPKPGFLAGLRKLATDNGIVLIFDEVVTGFRLAWGGGQAYYGVTPDVCTLGKVIGGGFPLAAIAGPSEIMRHFDKSAVGEDDFLVQIGTLSGNPVAASAGSATLDVLEEPGSFERLFDTGNTLMSALTEMLRKARVAARVVGEPPMFDICFADVDVVDYRTWNKTDTAMAQRFNRAMLANGVLKSEGKTYISTAHDAHDIAHTIAAWEKAIDVVRRSQAA